MCGWVEPNKEQQLQNHSYILKLRLSITDYSILSQVLVLSTQVALHKLVTDLVTA